MVIADKDDLIADGVDGLRVSTSIVGAAVDGLENSTTAGVTVDELEVGTSVCAAADGLRVDSSTVGAAFS